MNYLRSLKDNLMLEFIYCSNTRIHFVSVECSITFTAVMSHHRAKFCRTYFIHKIPALCLQINSFLLCPSVCMYFKANTGNFEVIVIKAPKKRMWDN